MKLIFLDNYLKDFSIKEDVSTKKFQTQNVMIRDKCDWDSAQKKSFLAKQQSFKL